MIAGVSVGHWTDSGALTGCTAILLPEGSTASGEVRGGAPATREFELLAPHRTVEHVDAVVLAGGSAYGLAACDGAATQEVGVVRVAAIVAVNAAGDLCERAPADLPEPVTRPLESTNVGAILTNARLTKLHCLLVAQSGHDGLARALEPVHSAFDGDALVAASCGDENAEPEHVRMLAARAVEAAVRSVL